MTPDTIPRWIDLGISSLRFLYRGEGSRPTVLLLHELGGTIETWDLAIECLIQEFDVIAPDLRGFGHSSAVTGTITLDDHVADLNGLLDACKIAGPVVIAGCAVGCAIAAAFAARHPERVSGIVMLSPALELPAERREAVLAQIADFEANGMRAIYDHTLGGGYPEQFQTVDPPRATTFMARWLDNSPSGFAANFRMLADLDIDPILSGIVCPVLLVAGELDPLRPPAYVQAVGDRLRQSQVITVSGGHHMPHQIPEIVADIIEGFCKRNG